MEKPRAKTRRTQRDGEADATAPLLLSSSAPADPWTQELRDTLVLYDNALLSQVAHHLLRVRGQYPPEELIEKLAAAMSNAAVIDRRVGELDEASRGLLALLAQSRQSRWRLGGLLELLSCLDVADGLAAVFHLFEVGLLYPDLQGQKRKLRSFEEWLGRGGATEFQVFVHPLVAARALREEQPLPVLEPATGKVHEIREADGLEIFLRLGVLWQQVHGLPLRLTQQGGFFKRDQERLAADPILSGPSTDELGPVPQLGHLLVALGLGIGLLQQVEAELVAGDLPVDWREGFAAALAGLWAVLPELTCWDAERGWRGLNAAPSPFASAGLIALALLGRLPERQWVAPQTVASWMREHHCYWRGVSPQEGQEKRSLAGWANHFLLGLAYQLRLIQAAKNSAGEPVVRLSPWGRWVLGLGPAPEEPAFSKRLLVQPNLEIIAYRQGLTPALIATLSRFCTWTILGSACTLQLQAETVYRGLERGIDLEQMLQTLQQHGVRETPANVVQLLKTWADKRERIAIYPSAILMEFSCEEELQEALARGVPGTRIAPLLVLVAREQDIDFRQFRLAGTRDYSLPPEPCVEIGPDGVTLTIDLARADLMLETELRRFAEPVSVNGRKAYRLTPASLAQARQGGMGLLNLEDWFLLRTGQRFTPAARLLLTGAENLPLAVKRLLVIEVPTADLADGLMQWPATRALIQARLGPQALVIEEGNLDALRATMQELQMQVIGPTG